MVINNKGHLLVGKVTSVSGKLAVNVEPDVYVVDPQTRPVFSLNRDLEHPLFLGKCSEPFIQELASHIGEAYAIIVLICCYSLTIARRGYSPICVCFSRSSSWSTFIWAGRIREDVFDKVKHDID